jgi:bifunctional enzyme CysN/CysC
MADPPVADGPTERGAAASPNVVWHESEVPREERWAAAGVQGATVWFTGLSGSGKSTIASGLAAALTARGVLSYTLDGDNLRHGLSGDLGFSAADRDEHIRRVAHVACLFADAGIVTLVPVVSPYRAGRDRARALHDAAALPFLEVFVDTPIAVCEERDPKGLYAKARAGELTGLTGVDDPYEAPLAAEVVLSGGAISVAEAVDELLAALAARGAVAADA